MYFYNYGLESKFRGGLKRQDNKVSVINHQIRGCDSSPTTGRQRMENTLQAEGSWGSLGKVRGDRKAVGLRQAGEKG